MSILVLGRESIQQLRNEIYVCRRRGRVVKYAGF